MKALGFAVLACFLLLLSPAFGQTPAPVGVYYCDEYPESPICICRQISDWDQFGRPLVWKELEDFIPTSDWFNMYCTGTLEGGLLRKQVGLEIEKPACTERFETERYETIQEEFCKKCPPPKAAGAWFPRQCIGSKTLMERKVVAYYFLPDVTECQEGSFIQLQVQTEGVCSAPFGESLLGLTRNWAVVVGLLAATAVLLYLRWRKK